MCRYESVINLFIQLSVRMWISNFPKMLNYSFKATHVYKKAGPVLQHFGNYCSVFHLNPTESSLT